MSNVQRFPDIFRGYIKKLKILWFKILQISLIKVYRHQNQQLLKKIMILGKSFVQTWSIELALKCSWYAILNIWSISCDFILF